MKTSILLFVLLLFTGLLGTALSQNLTASDYLAKSSSQEESGEINDALHTLFDARATLDKPNLEIAIEYIRIVTQHTKNDYYKMAYAMYRWGMSSDDVEANRHALTSEIKRLIPIAPDSVYADWRRMVNDRNPAVYKSIIAFWDSINFLPSPNYNARLLEHWERISYARKHYNTQSKAPYGTDIRGEFYVKYGEPAKTGTMEVEISPEEIQSVLSKMNVFYYNYSSTIDYYLDSINLTTAEHPISNIEIWKYNSTREDSDSYLMLYFIKNSNDGYEQIDVIDDLILSSSFLGNNRLNRETNDNIRARNSRTQLPSSGLLKQWIYYNRLRTFDETFAEIYAGMENDRFSEASSNFKTRSGHNFKFLNRAQAKKNLEDAPATSSTIRNMVMDVPIDIKQYRLLNDDNEPIFITYVENKPLNALYFDLLHSSENFGAQQDFLLENIEDNWTDNRESDRMNTTEIVISDEEKLKSYQLRNTLHLRGNDMQLLSRYHNNPVLIVDGEEKDTPSVSIFEIPYLGEGTQQIFFAELRNNDPESTPAFNSALPSNLRGLSELRVPQPGHLSMEPGRLMASDLILGYHKNEAIREINLFPFIVASDNKVPHDEPLVVHFEVYQLATDDQGLSRFEVDYEFSTISRFFNLFGRTIKGISSTLQFVHDSDRFNESLEIETGALSPGSYDLDLTITDTITGQTTERSVRFEVIENREFYLSSN